MSREVDAVMSYSGEFGDRQKKKSEVRKKNLKSGEG